MRKLFLLFAVVFSFTLLFTGCDSSDSPGGTNVQEENIDEGDIVKMSSDGKIFNFQSDGITITKVSSGSLKPLAKSALPKIVPIEMYITDTQLITIGGTSNIFYEGGNNSYYRSSYEKCTLTVYDITGLTAESENAVLPTLYTLEMNAEYNTSRIYTETGIMYLVFLSAMNDVFGEFGDISNTADIPYTENNTQKSVQEVVNLPTISSMAGYLSSSSELNNSNSAATVFYKIDLNDLTKNCISSAYYGATFQTIYASDYGLYPVYTISTRTTVGESNRRGCYGGSYYQYQLLTVVTKVRLDDLTIRASVVMKDYTIYGRHAVKDTEDNIFIVATKTGGEGTSMLCFNSTLKLVGAQHGIAKRERVYAVTYEINEESQYCYVVTYRNTDPLFKINITNPASPEVLGDLKITGYSTYLHDFGNNRMIGLGYDGNASAANLNTKVTLFDTSGDSPTAINSIVIQGTVLVEAINNPKAFCVAEQYGIFGFSALKTVGQTTKQGFYIFAIVEDQLIDAAYISNFPSGEVPVGAVNSQYDNFRKFINRGMLYEGYLYTVSDGWIVSYNAETLSNGTVQAVATLSTATAEVD